MGNGSDPTVDLQAEVAKRKAWFFECQLRRLNMTSFKDVVAESPDVLLKLISEPQTREGLDAGPVGSRPQPTGPEPGRVYLDSRHPVWDEDEQARRGKFSRGLTGHLCNWLEFREPLRLAAELAALKDQFEASRFSSVIDLGPAVNLYGRKDAPSDGGFEPPNDGGNVAHAVSRAAIAAMKPWLIPELYHPRHPDSAPPVQWLENLEQFIHDFESELQIAVGANAGVALPFDASRLGDYRSWLGLLMEAASTRDRGAYVKASFLDRLPGEDHKYQYNVKIRTNGYALANAVDYPFSFKVKYWTRIVQSSLKEVIVNKADSDMGLCQLMRLVYLFGDLPAAMGEGRELPWRKRSPPPPEFDAFFDLRAGEPDIKKDDALVQRLRSAQARLRAILEENALRPLSGSPVFSPLVQEVLRQGIRSYKFWLDEPLRAMGNTRLNKARADLGKGSADAEMEYWSENHYIMFASSEYLAGQLWEGDQFQPGPEFLEPGSKVGVLSGRERKERGRARVLKWLHNRLMFGWTEFNSSGYYREHLWAILNLADFALDEEVRDKAALVVDLLLFDVVRFTHRGSFCAAGGRSQFKSKASGWDSGLGDVVEILLGTRGIFTEGDSNIGASLATSTYKAPDVLLEIGSAPPAQPWTDRSRVSITFDEAPKYGIGYSLQSVASISLNAGYAARRARYYPFLEAVKQELARTHHDYTGTEDDTVFWWSTSAYYNKQVVRGTFACIHKYGLDGCTIFAGFLPFLIGTLMPMIEKVQGAFFPSAIGLVTGPLGSVADSINAVDSLEEGSEDLSILLDGNTRTRANILTYRSSGAMLSSLQNFRAGEFNFQSDISHATLNRALGVFTTAGFEGLDLTDLPVFIAGLSAGALASAVGLPLAAVGGIGALAASASVDGDNPFGDDIDGPGWWTGYWALPRVVQHGAAAILIYDFTSVQEFLAETGSHVWFPKAGFDSVHEVRCGAYDDDNFFLADIDNIGPKGFWLFGKVVHDLPGVPASDRPEGYIGVFSNQRPEWLSLDNDEEIYNRRHKAATKDDPPRFGVLVPDPFVDRDFYVNGQNIWIVQVGSKDEFGSYEAFKQRVSSAKVTVDDAGDMECTYHMPLPGGGSESVSIKYEDGGEFEVNGQSFQTDLYPRFENPFVRGGRVEWGQRAYLIEYRGKLLLHDFSDFSRPRRAEKLELAPNAANTVKAFVIFQRTTGEALAPFTSGSAAIRIGCETAAEEQVIAAGPIAEDTDHDAEWIFCDRELAVSPDLSLTMHHRAFAGGDDDTEWEVHIRLKALMGDYQLRDCTVAFPSVRFDEDRQSSFPVPFSIRLSRWHAWEPVPDSRKMHAFFIADRPQWHAMYYGYVDLFASENGRFWHRHLNACMTGSPQWQALPYGQDGPYFDGESAVCAISTLLESVACFAVDDGKLFATWLDDSRRWVNWVNLEPWVYAPGFLGLPDPNLPPLNVAAARGPVFAGLSVSTAFAAEILFLGVDGNLYAHYDWRPFAAGPWHKIEVSDFKVREGADAQVAADRLFVLSTNGTVWQTPRAGSGYASAWEAVTPPGLKVSCFAVFAEPATCHVIVTAADGSVWAAILGDTEAPAWIPLGKPGGARVAQQVRVAGAIPYPGRLDIFTVALGDIVYTKGWNAGVGWDAWHPPYDGEQGFAANIWASPVVAHRIDRQVELFTQSQDGHLFRTWWS